MKKDLLYILLASIFLKIFILISIIFNIIGLILDHKGYYFVNIIINLGLLSWSILIYNYIKKEFKKYNKKKYVCNECGKLTSDEENKPCYACSHPVDFEI